MELAPISGLNFYFLIIFFPEKALPAGIADRKPCPIIAAWVPHHIVHPGCFFSSCYFVSGA